MTEAYLKWEEPLAKFFDTAAELASVFLPFKSTDAKKTKGEVHTLTTELLRYVGFDRHTFKYM